MYSINVIKSLTNGINFPRDEEDRAELIQAYYDLTLPDARALADYALQVKDADTGDVILQNLALLVPGSLDQVPVPDLLDRHIFEGEHVFLCARPEVRDAIIARIDQGDDLDHWVKALAWVGDEPSQRKLVELLFSGERFSDQEIREMANSISAAGWEISAQGKKRELFYREQFDLIGEETDTPQTIDARCPWCGQILFTPFRFDLTDPRLSFLHLPWKQLHIAACFHCLDFTPLYWEITADGQAAWSTHNVRPDFLEIRDYPYEVEKQFSQVRLVIGEKRNSPYEREGWLPASADYLGGLPGWVQYPEYPVCVKCHQRMKFLAQFDYGQVYYAFICPDCAIAATWTQAG